MIMRRNTRACHQLVTASFPTTDTSNTMGSAGCYGPHGEAWGPTQSQRSFLLCHLSQSSPLNVECVASRNQRDVPGAVLLPCGRKKTRIYLLIWRRYLSTYLITGPLKIFLNDRSLNFHHPAKASCTLVFPAVRLHRMSSM